MAGPNEVLDKGFVATGSNAYEFGQLVTLVDSESVVGSGAGAGSIGVCQEDLDADKVTTGRAVVNVRLMGISRVIAGTGGLALGDGVVSDANGHGVAATGTAGTLVAANGVCIRPAAAGEQADVLLVPGGATTV